MSETYEFASLISHSSKDADIAMQLCAALEARGVKCWIAPRDVTPGADYADEIMLGIERASTMVVLVSNHSNTSAHVLREVEQAVRLGRPIFPLFTEDVRLVRRLDYYIAPIHWLHMGSAPLSKHAETLKRAIERDDDWKSSASRPSLQRSLRHRPLAVMAPAFVASLAAGGVLLAGAWLWTVQRDADEQARIDAQPDALGFIAIAAGEASGARIEAEVAISLFAQSVRYSDLQAKLAILDNDRVIATEDLRPSMNLAQVGGSQMLRVALPSGGDRIATCLSLPHPRLAGRFRVTQHYAMTHLAEGNASRIAFSKSGTPAVSPEEGQPCK